MYEGRYCRKFLEFRLKVAEDEIGDGASCGILKSEVDVVVGLVISTISSFSVIYEDEYLLFRKHKVKNIPTPIPTKKQNQLKKKN